MKLAIISDTHFGFREGTELELDCYINAEQALKKAFETCDLILMPGDIFDLETPSQLTFDRTFKLFSEFIKENNQKCIMKIPIIAIAGTHEYKGKEYTNPLDVLESAKYIIQLKHNSFSFSKTGEDCTVFGMSGVPEKVAKDVLHKLNFQPKENSVNILMTHQSYKELLAFDDEMISTLTFEDLPEGFDLYINGHIHKHHLLKTQKGPVLIPGSTIVTQIKQNEIQDKRGFCIYDTETKSIEFSPIKTQRNIFYFEIEEKETTKEKLKEKICDKIKTISGKENTNKYSIFGKEVLLLPVIKIKISATLKLGENAQISERDFDAKDFILQIDKKINVSQLKEKIAEINFEKDKEKAIEKSEEFFLENLKKTEFKNSFEPVTLLQHLKQKNSDNATQYILEKIQKDSETISQ